MGGHTGAHEDKSDYSGPRFKSPSPGSSVDLIFILKTHTLSFSLSRKIEHNEYMLKVREPLSNINYLDNTLNSVH